MKEEDNTKVELDHVKHLQGSGYEFICSSCNFVYRQKPKDGCEHCDSTKFHPIRESIQKLELMV